MGKKKKDPILEQIKSPQCRAAVEWLSSAAAATVPAEILEGLRIAASLIDSVEALHVSRKALYRQLQRALGVLPSTERNNSTKPKSPGEPTRSRNKARDPVERLLDEQKDATRLRDWHRKQMNKQKRRQKHAESRLDALRPVTDEDDEVLSEEEELRCERESEEYSARLDLGGGADPSLDRPAETLMHGGIAQVLEEDEKCHVDREQLPRSAVVKRSFFETRQRLDFGFFIRQKNIEVEKLVVEQGNSTTIVGGDIEEFGPPKMSVTWSFLAHVSMMVSQLALPLHRIAKMLSSKIKRFTSAEMSRYYRYVAEHFVAIYIHLGRQLAQAPVLCGDDTPSLVLEVTRAHDAHVKGEQSAFPWQSYATAELAQKAFAEGQNNTLALQTAMAFGFASTRKDGTGKKISHNTSVLSGRAVADDPASTIVFYRSHLGSMGNLLDAILPHRDPQNHHLVVQSDLSTTNLIGDKEWCERFDVNLAGCASHARRTFAIYEQEEPFYCDAILHLFKGIPLSENSLDLMGRNTVNTAAVRDVDQRIYWEGIREYCVILGNKWSRSTPLGGAARYVLRHYDKLTYYLTDHRVSPSNNFSERMLRQEKLIQNNSLFRATINGRCALDIMRTILQTAMAAGVDPAAYLMWVMRMPKDSVAAEPEGFTPSAFAKWWAEQQACEALDAALASPEPAIADQ